MSCPNHSQGTMIFIPEKPLTFVSVERDTQNKE
jgi:hypothetical protein